MPHLKPPTSHILDSTRGYLTIAEAAAQLDVTPHTLYTAARRGTLERFYYPGKTCTGWSVYFRQSDIEKFLRRPRPQSPISFKQASEILGITRLGINLYLRTGRLHSFRIPLANGKDRNFVWLDRQEVESLAHERAHKQHHGTPPALAKMLNSNPRPTIADILRHRPPGISDVDIARAFGVSKQRVGHIKQKVRSQHG